MPCNTLPRFAAIASFAVKSGAFILFVLAPGIANAAFFQLAETSPAAIGSANAGGAALAEDASTVWFNPAGLTRLSGSQFVAGGHLIKLSTEFRKTSATTVFGTQISGGDGGNAGANALVPNFYYSQPLSNGITFGLGVNAPFGLATDYDEGWVGRYHADRSEIKSVNVNPALGYKLNENFSLGAGINYQKLEAELTQAVDFGSICQANGAGGVCGPPGGNDGRAAVEADDDAWGYNFGLLWQPAAGTRLGLAYRSKMKYGLTGSVDITAPANVPGAITTSAGLVDSGVKANVTLPAILSLSVHHRLGPAWAIMGDVTRTYWSKLPELRIDFDSAQADSVVTLGLKDVNRYSIGATYNASSTWTYRAGLALDQTPTPSAELRTPRLPDEDRTWLAVGAGYKPSDKFSVDFAYAYLLVDDASINKTTGASPTGENFFRGNLSGQYEAAIHILSAQANWKF